MSKPAEYEQASVPPTDREAAYLRVLASPEFQELRHKYRSWVIPATIAGLTFYFVYVFMSTYAVDFMSQKVIGNVNVGLIFGLLQFVATFAVTMAYVRYADRELDPRSSKIRDEMEAEGLA
ncbi:clumping factor B [Aeromicrobium flavum]|uniref:Clumping factor B n=1 Tax=Aeromicrobium flavum TaxID=416568 RepID=A0A512HR63_9ACTN|nr:clumping factor B [Aeromicrobium flavum]